MCSNTRSPQYQLWFDRKFVWRDTTGRAQTSETFLGNDKRMSRWKGPCLQHRCKEIARGERYWQRRAENSASCLKKVRKSHQTFHLFLLRNFAVAGGDIQPISKEKAHSLITKPKWTFVLWNSIVIIAFSCVCTSLGTRNVCIFRCCKRSPTLWNTPLTFYPHTCRLAQERHHLHMPNSWPVLHVAKKGSIGRKPSRRKKCGDIEQ